MRTFVAFAAFLALVVSVVWAAPSHVFAQPRAITVKIDGRIGKAPDEGRARARWHLRVDRKDIELYVTKLEILAGATTNAEVIRHLKANRAAILTSGGADALKTIADAPEGANAVIQGTMRWAETPPILLVSTASAK